MMAGTEATISELRAIAGYPNITVPAGIIFGLPVGISFFAGRFQEGTLIRPTPGDEFAGLELGDPC